MLVYDITQEQTYSNVSKWLRNIEEVRTNLMYMTLLCIFMQARSQEVHALLCFLVGIECS